MAIAYQSILPSLDWLGSGFVLRVANSACRPNVMDWADNDRISIGLNFSIAIESSYCLRIRDSEMAVKTGRDREARLTLAQVIQQETLLAQLHSQVDRAEELLISSQNRLTQEQLEVERYRAEIQQTKDLSRVNVALGEIARINDGLDGRSAKATFENAQMQATEYEMQQKILADLSQNRSELTNENSDRELQERVNERLAKLKEHNSELPHN